jgi:hypothetical protein
MLIACGTHKTYQDPLPEAYVATVKGSRAAVGVRIFFRIPKSNGEEDIAYALEVPNGPQRIKVFFSLPNGEVSSVARQLTFYAEGGRTYRVKGADLDSRVWLWIEEEGTDAVVGGIRP